MEIVKNSIWISARCQEQEKIVSKHIRFPYPFTHGVCSLSQLLLLERGRVDPGQVAHPSQGQQKNKAYTLTFTPRVNLDSSVILTCTWELAGVPNVHPACRRTCKLLTERPQQRFEPGTLFLSGDSVNHHFSPKHSMTFSMMWIRLCNNSLRNVTACLVWVSGWN